MDVSLNINYNKFPYNIYNKKLRRIKYQNNGFDKRCGSGRSKKQKKN